MSDKLITRHYPPTVADTQRIGYASAASTTAPRVAYISGQVPWKIDSLTPPESFEDQANLVIDNLTKVLADLGGDASNLACLRAYIVGINTDRARLVMMKLAALCNGAAPATTIIGVEALVEPRIQIEIEGIAHLSA
jgi:enamine deaminase RidA (YjgF/YER057c/UK114 family)